MGKCLLDVFGTKKITTTDENLRANISAWKQFTLYGSWVSGPMFPATLGFCPSFASTPWRLRFHPPFMFATLSNRVWNLVHETKWILNITGTWTSRHRTLLRLKNPWFVMHHGLLRVGCELIGWKPGMWKQQSGDPLKYVSETLDLLPVSCYGFVILLAHHPPSSRNEAFWIRSSGPCGDGQGRSLWFGLRVEMKNRRG